MDNEIEFNIKEMAMEMRREFGSDLELSHEQSSEERMRRFLMSLILLYLS